MGIIAKIQEWIEKRKLKQKAMQLEDATTKEVRAFIAEFEALENIEDDSERKMEQKALIEQLAAKVQTGQINLGGKEDEIQKNAIFVVERYFKDSPKISATARNIREGKVVRAIEKELAKRPPNLATIENIVLEFLNESQKDENCPEHLKVYSRKQKQDMVLELLGRHISEPMLFSMYKNSLGKLYQYSFADDIAMSQGNSEKQRLYEEYIRDFLDGKEMPEDFIVNSFKNAPFIERREKIRKCEKYGIPYSDDEPITIYEATEENRADVENQNRELASKKLKEDVKSSDLVLVRTTNVLPRHGVVETQDKYSTPIMDGSFFDNEIKEAGLNPQDYEMAAFRSRRTVHWTLNGLVGSHAYGKFENRNYILIEPFEEQENNNGLLNIDEADTYFQEDVKLSPRATILMHVERYKEECKDPKKKQELSRYNIALYVGDEDLAVEMLLHDKGYVSGSIGMWGFTTNRTNPEDQYAGRLQEKMRDIVASKDGRVTYAHVHAYTDSYKQDGARGRELMNERLDRFLKYLFENSGVPFSIPYMKAFFKARLYDWGRDDTYKKYLENVEEGPEIKQMTPKEVFEAIGAERMKELTQGYNEMIFEEHRRARAERDKQLIQKGLLTPEEIQAETEDAR